MMQGFEYPTEPHFRRHGPGGYRDYESYRDWVRDEFMFRCVYCLHRERWYGRGTTFHIDHAVPAEADPGKRLDYANLLYTCATCNSAKSSILGVPDPCVCAFADLVRITDDGRAVAINKLGESLIKKLRLDSAANAQHRARWMQTLKALRLTDPSLYSEYMAFPDELPDLRKKNVPANSSPESTHECYYALRERGELPTTY
jgi:hypothetical protein